MAETIELWARSPQNGTYFPIRTFNLSSLRAEGWGDDYMLTFKGQRDQLIVAPSECSDAIPQVDSPVQDLNPATGGKPDRTSLSEVENVTVFFATGQSKI